jgi:hypothetical protein
MTHREFITWQEWLQEEWNRPSRTDHYLMRIALEVASVLAKDPKSIKIGQFKLEFGKPDPENPDEPSAPKMTKERAANIAKLTWAKRLGIPLDKLNTVPRS